MDFLLLSTTDYWRDVMIHMWRRLGDVKIIKNVRCVIDKQLDFVSPCKFYSCIYNRLLVLSKNIQHFTQHTRTRECPFKFPEDFYLQLPSLCVSVTLQWVWSDEMCVQVSIPYCMWIFNPCHIYSVHTSHHVKHLLCLRQGPCQYTACR